MKISISFSLFIFLGFAIFANLSHAQSISDSERRLLPSDSAGNILGFGNSIAVDGNFAAIGAAGRTDGKGAVYVLRRDEAGMWTEVAILSASDGAAGDFFGSEVDLKGDVLIIGQIGAFGTSGSAYIFRRTSEDGTQWVEEARLMPDVQLADDQFGASVNIDGDRAIVGAYRHTESASLDLAGAAYIFERDNTGWTQQNKLLASDPMRSDGFGRSVAICGDWAIVGADGQDAAGENSGAAYVYVRGGQGWLFSAKLVASDGAPLHNFGWDIAMNGDFAIIGATQSQAEGNGAAYIFSLMGSTWSQQAQLVASDGAPSDNFGSRVAIGGGGVYTVVGARSNRDRGTFTGAAYVYERDGSIWAEKAALLPDMISGGDFYGAGVALDESNILVGASSDEGSGAVYVYDTMSMTGVATEGTPHLPDTPVLMPAYPNPFNPSTLIQYRLTEPSVVQLVIYNILGQTVHTLVDAQQTVGEYTVLWDGKDDAGRVLPSGTYLYRMRAGQFTQTQSVLLVK